VYLSQLKQVSFVLISEVFIKIIGFLTLPIVFYSIGNANFGLVTSIEAILLIFAPVFTFNTESYLTRFYHKWDANNNKKRIGSLFLFNISIIIFSFLIFLIFGYFAYNYYKINRYISLQELKIELFAIFFYSLSIFPLALIRIKEKTKFFAFIRIFKFVILQALILYFFYNKESKPWKYFFANLITESLTFLILISFTFKYYKFHYSTIFFKKIIKFSFPLIPNSILSSFIFTIDKFIFLTFTNIEITGLYIISLKFSGIIAQIHSILKISYGPFLYKTLASNMENKFQFLSNSVKLYITPLFLTSIFINLFFYDYWYLFLKTNTKLLIFVPVAIFSEVLLDLYIYLTPGIILSNKTYLSIIPSIVQVLTFIIPVYILYNSIGFYSILFSKVLSSTIFLLLNQYFTKKYYSDWIPPNKYVSLFFLIMLFASLLGYCRSYFTYLESLFLVISTILISFFLYIIYFRKITSDKITTKV
jgi:O-antigen/teichoic acid export membrane protein